MFLRYNEIMKRTDVVRMLTISPSAIGRLHGVGLQKKQYRQHRTELAVQIRSQIV